LPLQPKSSNKKPLKSNLDPNDPNSSRFQMSVLDKLQTKNRTNSPDVDNSESGGATHFNKREIKPFKITEIDKKNVIKTKPAKTSIEKATVTDLEVIKILNGFIFILFLIFIICLNLFGLFILPYFVKKSLSIDD
jgi:hypothetical protein